MGIRSRSAEKKSKSEKKIKLANALKEFTRAKAEAELTAGADPSHTKFTRHRNYHIRHRAWHLMGCPVPEKTSERKELFESLTKDRSLACQTRLDALFNPPQNDEQAAVA